jgi:hypothetical protein
MAKRTVNESSSVSSHDQRKPDEDVEQRQVSSSKGLFRELLAKWKAMSRLAKLAWILTVIAAVPGTIATVDKIIDGPILRYVLSKVNKIWPPKTDMDTDFKMLRIFMQQGARENVRKKYNDIVTKHPEAQAYLDREEYSDLKKYLLQTEVMGSGMVH